MARAVTNHMPWVEWIEAWPRPRPRMPSQMNFMLLQIMAYPKDQNILSVESQKGSITIQRCSVENQKGAIAIDISTAIAPFWFSTEHLWILIVPLWHSTDNIIAVSSSALVPFLNGLRFYANEVHVCHSVLTPWNSACRTLQHIASQWNRVGVWRA